MQQKPDPSEAGNFVWNGILFSEGLRHGFLKSMNWDEIRVLGLDSAGLGVYAFVKKKQINLL